MAFTDTTNTPPPPPSPALGRVLIGNADTGDTLTVTRKAFASVYKDKGFAILEGETTAARPEAFVAGANIGVVLAWVDGIAERARQALESELEQKAPRPKLVAALELVIDEEARAAGELGSGDSLTA